MPLCLSVLKLLRLEILKGTEQIPNHCMITLPSPKSIIYVHYTYFSFSVFRNYMSTYILLSVLRFLPAEGIVFCGCFSKNKVLTRNNLSKRAGKEMMLLVYFVVRLRQSTTFSLVVL